ncbi:hypothetical protein ACIRU3_42050 [Streptomyces sp. NPDC101151]|uniref:hypothetical protein n=1 Tax=Streptomyces sp. NPDC101151 TaxID=3366115 RepID=UPI0037F710C4
MIMVLANANNEDSGYFVNVAELPNHAWYIAQPPLQQQRLSAMAADPNSYLDVATAVDFARNLVVAAVDGSGGQEEIDFLAAAYRERGHLSVHDPAMNPNFLGFHLAQLGVPQDQRLTLVTGSVTDFGHHVPKTDLFIPHPGPAWVGALDNDVATCIEYVLGRQSTAFVLTDAEPTSPQSTNLANRLAAINQANANQTGYLPLVTTIEDPVVRRTETDRFVTFGEPGMTIRTHHSPEYKVVRITR